MVKVLVTLFCIALIVDQLYLMWLRLRTPSPAEHFVAEFERKVRQIAKRGEDNE